MGIRPHHLTPDGTAAGSVKISGTVLVAEISGSESVIHVSVHDNDWVSESHGVRPYKVGDFADFFMRVDRCLYFGGDGSFLAG
jgi:glycerol transport system ATP-binding protein